VNYRPTEAVVDLGAVRHNVRRLKPPDAELMAVVKADGYGHGAAAVAGAALDAGATWLGVALVEEGLALRRGGITAPILVLSELPPGSEEDALAGGLSPALYTESGLDALAAASRALGRTVGVHVKLDTGMHRVGLDPEKAEPFMRTAVERGLDLEGLWTHFAVADLPGHPSVSAQLNRFTAAAEELERAGLRPPLLHAANTAATLTVPSAHLDLVRVGIGMYGLAPSPELGRLDLRPAMALRSHVSMVRRLPAGEAISYGHRYRLERESTVATVPIGYADGYARRLTETGRVLIRGRRYPVAGTVTMDQLMVDCEDDPVEAGDEVILFGSQRREEITADEVAGWSASIGYEVVCGVSARVPRRYEGER
jgi:alanine racemase